MIAQAICNSFKAEMFSGIHDLDNDVFKMALFRATAAIVGTFGAETTNYDQMDDDEVVGTGYVAGGVVAVGATPVLIGTTAIVDFDDVTYPSVTIVTRGALLYNTSKGNRAVAIWDFGTDKTIVTADFKLQMPLPTAFAALLRLV